jgi:two-component system sensor histidine kinase FlrB
MFEPFYTTKTQGTGLGLAVVNTVAKSHKGFVHCANREHQSGAVFSIAIPVTPISHQESASSEPMQNDNAFDSNLATQATTNYI